MITYNSSYRPEFDDDGNLVYFIINVNELFNTTLNYKGMMTSLRQALFISRQRVPFKTGRLRSSYKMERLNSNTVRLSFDPSVLGEVYYAKYLIEYHKTRLWLQIVMTVFLYNLVKSIRDIEAKKKKDKKTKIALTAALVLLEKMNEDLKKQQKEVVNNDKL